MRAEVKRDVLGILDYGSERERDEKLLHRSLGSYIRELSIRGFPGGSGLQRNACNIRSPSPVFFL